MQQGILSKCSNAAEKDMVETEQKHHSRLYDEVDYVPDSYKVTKLDIFWLITSLFSHVIDVAFDIYVAVNYYFISQTRNFSWTLVFIIVPSLCTTLVSMRWYIMDYKEKKSPLKKSVMRCLALALQLAPTIRYAESLMYALKSRRYRKEGNKVKEREFCRLMLKEDADAALLRLIECFLESAPQLVLQLSILMYKTHPSNTLLDNAQWLAVITSLVGLAWAVASYQRSLRYPQENKDNISKKGMTLQILWHLMIVASRIISLSCIATQYPLWVIGLCVLHIVFFHIYLILKGPKGACGDSMLWQNGLCLILAVIYIFTGIQVRDGNTRWFFTLFYSLFFVENVILIILWFIFVSNAVDQWLLWFVPCASVGCFILGIITMLLYYKYFHPKKLTVNIAL